MVLGLIVLPDHVPYGEWTITFIVAALVVMIIISPVASPNKPIISLQKWKYMKFMTAVIAAVESLVIIVLMKIGNSYSYPLFWIMTIQALQLIPGAILYGFGKRAIRERQ